MKYLIPLAALSAALISAPAFADDNQTLLIKDFIGTVSITTGDSFSVSGDTGDINETSDNGLIIDGNQKINHVNCNRSGDGVKISTKKWRLFKRARDFKDIKDYPNVDITVPQDTHLEIIDSVILGTGETFESVDARIHSCGSLQIGDVRGLVKLRTSGAGKFTAGNIGTADLRVSGAGGVSFGNMGDAEVSVSGSGDVLLGDMETALIKISGAGNLKGGHINGDAKISLSGSGDIAMDSLRGNLVYGGSGASGFYLNQINGDASVALSGAGDVEINGGTIPKLDINSSGGSRLVFNGTAGDVTVVSSGGGAVNIDKATGQSDVKASGGASVKIGDTRYRR